MANLKLLKPKVKELATKLIRECARVGNPIIITQTLRTIAEQDKLYAQGRTIPGNIVTNAKGGYSFHNYGAAFDIVPVDILQRPMWNNVNAFKLAGKIGVNLGLEWGGNWTSFIDMPHFQYTSRYTIDDFRFNKIDERRFKTQFFLLEKITHLKQLLSDLLKNYGN